MPPTPSPAPIDVFVHSGAPDWWQIVAALGPIAVIIGAFLAAFMAWRTLRQKAAADNRAEWWRRTQWALDHALDADENTKALGLVTLDVLAHSELARKEELELLDIAWKSVTGPDENGNEDPGPPTTIARRVLTLDSSTDIRVAMRDIIRRRSRIRDTFPRIGRRPDRSGAQPPGDGPSPATDPVDSGANLGDNGATDKAMTEEG